MMRFPGRAAVALLVLIAAGAIYEQVGRHRDRTRYPRIGGPVDIGGRTLNLFCSGDGGPTVVFEGAGHTAGFAWSAMQGEVAKFTRACWYDRAGYGWSDPGPSPRTFRSIAADLHALLHSARVPGPYVLVGATAGAFHVRVYSGTYPDDVAGAVLVQATDWDVFAHEPEYMKGGVGNLPPVVQRFACTVLQPVLMRLGVIRLMGNPGAGRPFGVANLAPEQREEAVFLSNNPSTAQTEGEGCVLNESMAELRASGNFGDRPLVVLSGTKPYRAPAPRYTQAVADLNRYYFDELQPRLAALSTRGRLVMQEGAADPASIVAAIRQVVSDVRGVRMDAAGTSEPPEGKTPPPNPARSRAQ
jgi:pimeloyl-ACP methyl ester carboxylesterase